MTIQDAYIKFLQKVNKNLSSDNIIADKSRFIILYNENQIKRIVELIEQGNDERNREINTFLLPNILLEKDKEETDRVLYKLPLNFLDLSSVYAYGSKGECKKQKISLYEIKDKNYTQVSQDNYSQPSFSYRESPFLIADSKVNILKGDFTIDNVYLTYYRYPKKVDIEGYIKIDEEASKDIHPEGDERFIDKVINMCAIDFNRNNLDTGAIQINKERTITNI